MPQSEQFFQAVLEHPEDNVLRLIYADWLEDIGDPCGALIRVQVELEQTPRGDLLWRALKNRETELLDQHLTDWLGPSARRVWKGFADAQYQPFFAEKGSCRLHRGFRETARMRARSFLELADEILVTLPLRELHLFLEYNEASIERDLKALAGCPPLFKIHHLILEFPYFNRHTNASVIKGLTNLLHSPYVAELESLRIHYAFETAPLVEALLQSPWLRNLRGLELHAPRPTESESEYQPPPARRDGIELLRTATNLPRLQALSVTDHRLSDSLFLPLFEAEWFEQLTVLNLLGNALSDETVLRLANSPVCANLKTLRLSRRPGQTSGNLQSPGMAALSKADFSQLTELDLSHQRIGSGKLKALLRSQSLGQLKSLDLSGNPLKDTGAEVLARAEVLSNLEILKLESCQLTDAGLTALAQSPHWKKLEQLFLGGKKNVFSSVGLETLLESPLAARLRTLSLAECGDLRKKGIRVLSDSPSLAGLAELDLSGQIMNAWRVKALTGSRHLEALAHLSWYQTRISTKQPNAEALLERRWPGRVRL